MPGSVGPAALVPLGWHEALVRLVKGHGQVAALPVAALQVPQRHGVASLAVRRQDEGIVTAEFQLGTFTERSQRQPVTVVGGTALAVLGAPHGADDDDGHAGVGELPQVVHRGVDGPRLSACSPGGGMRWM